MKTTTRSRNVNKVSGEELTMESSARAVSKRERVAILRQVREIRASWTDSERCLRALQGRERRAELCRMLFA